MKTRKMKVITKSIKVDFAGGEHIKSAVRDAMRLAMYVGVPVKFKFNGVPMTIKPELNTRDFLYVEEYNSKLEKKGKK